jgi:hypothetical protein
MARAVRGGPPLRPMRATTAATSRLLPGVGGGFLGGLLVSEILGGGFGGYGGWGEPGVVADPGPDFGGGDFGGGDFGGGDFGGGDFGGGGDF